MSLEAGHWSTEPAIAVDRLTTVDAGGPRGGSLTQVTFEVMVGELTVLFGLPDAGPSTVLEILAGRGPLVTGQLRARGRTVDLGSASSPRLTLIGLASPAAVARSSTIGRAVRSDVEPARAAAALQLLEITRPRSREPRHLSRATLMLLALGRELTGNPAVLAADHPTAGLSPEESRFLVARLRDVVDLEGRTVLVASRDPLLTADADHIVGFQEGVVCDDRWVDLPAEQAPADLDGPSSRQADDRRVR